MTPMIDVVFLLIVFFLCIEFKVLEGRLDAWLPRDHGARADVVAPQERLHVRVHVLADGEPRPDPDAAVVAGRPRRHRLEGHRVRFEVGPVPCADFAACERELRRLAGDPALLVADPKTGGLKRITCVVDGLRGTRYDDVARTADLCRVAGFDEVTFGGGLGPR